MPVYTFCSSLPKLSEALTAHLSQKSRGTVADLADVTTFLQGVFDMCWATSMNAVCVDPMAQMFEALIQQVRADLCVLGLLGIWCHSSLHVLVCVCARQNGEATSVIASTLTDAISLICTFEEHHAGAWPWCAFYLVSVFFSCVWCIRGTNIGVSR